MSATADLAAQQSSLKARINGLGPPPTGDPAALRAYAQFLEQEAHKAAQIAHHEATLIKQIDFVSGGALRLFSNMAEVAKSFGAAADMLGHAAQMIARRAGHLANAQDDWLRQRTALDGQLAELDRRAARQSA
ncbi:MAG: hypothetical protein QOD69_490 [Solirubrobacteraceae bacterium]|nr:hypothetical protein [Solirubrobacteraceae bacterium]